MLRTCRAWSTAVHADPNLWKAIALRASPRLLELSKKMPSRSWLELYRAHYEMKASTPPVATNSTSLQDYVLTYELVLNTEVVVAWSGSLELGGGDEFPSIELWSADNPPAALSADGFWDEDELIDDRRHVGPDESR